MLKSSITQIARLESRRLLSAELIDGVVVVTGTNEADTITLTDIGDSYVSITVNEEDFTFEQQIWKIKVNALDGDDSVVNHRYHHWVSISGGAGDDTLRGGAGRSFLYGGEGDDLLTGGSKTDHLYGDRDSSSGPTREGDDTMNGYGGIDYLYSDDGEDHLDGGSSPGGEYYGNDSLQLDRRTEDLHISLDGVANDGNLIIIGCENISTGSGDDTIIGNEKPNRLFGGAGDDTLRGLRGNDFLFGDGLDGSSLTGNDSITGDSGNDTVTSGLGTDMVWLGSGDDHAADCHGDGAIYAGSGNDLFSIDGNFDLFGEAGDDMLLIYYNDDDVTYSRIIDGGSGTDVYDANPFNGTEVKGMDISLDRAANDGRFDTADSDNVRFVEKVSGNNAHDLIDASSAGYSVTLWGAGGRDTLIGGSSADEVNGNDQNDSLIGNGGEDRLNGGDGNDYLIGNAGPDVLNGGRGQDTIHADDNIADHVLGGSGGSDEADVDDGLDEVSGVEEFI